MRATAILLSKEDRTHDELANSQQDSVHSSDVLTVQHEPVTTDVHSSEADSTRKEQASSGSRRSRRDRDRSRTGEANGSQPSNSGRSNANRSGSQQLHENERAHPSQLQCEAARYNSLHRIFLTLHTCCSRKKEDDAAFKMKTAIVLTMQIRLYLAPPGMLPCTET